MPDKTARGTVLIAKDGRLCVLRDSEDHGLVFFQPTPRPGLVPLVDYNGVNRSSKVPGQTYDDLELLEGNAEMIGQAFWKWSNNIGQPERRARRGLIMDVLAMTFERNYGNLKPSPKFQFYAAELTNSNGRAIEVGGKDCRYPYRPPEHRLLPVGDELFKLAVEQYKSFELVYSGLPTQPTVKAIEEMNRERQRLETTKPAAKVHVVSAKQALFNPSNEEDQDDEETLPASKLEEEAHPEARPEAQSRTPAQREGAGIAKIATTPVGAASSVVRSAEGKEDEDMDAEDINLEMRHVELEQRKIRLHQMRRALEKKKRRRKEG